MVIEFSSPLKDLASIL